MNLLIVEDEPELSRNIYTYLLQNMHTCEIAPDYPSAKARLAEGSYDCILLDISLPGGSGLDLLKKLKADKVTSGTLIISAKDSLDDKLAGLELGADDYLTKPFHLAELAARVTAIIRRRTFEGNNIIQLGLLNIDIVEKSVQTSKAVLNLTRKEYELLLYFASNKNRVVTKDSIADHLWEGQAHMADTYDLIYTHIKNLRKKLAEAGCPDYLRSVYGMGYRFSISE